MPQFEPGYSVRDGRNHHLAGRDEANSPIQRQRLNRASPRAPDQSPATNRRSLRPARSARPRHQNKQERRRNFTEDQCRFLESWIDSNPYPKPDELNALAKQTDHTPGQVNGWFSRYRKRKSIRISHEEPNRLSDAWAAQITPGFGESHLPGEPSGTNMEVEDQSASLHKIFLPCRSISPLETYLHTSSRDEGFPPLTADNLQSDNNPPYFSTRGGRTVGRRDALSRSSKATETAQEQRPPSQPLRQQSGFSIQSSDTAGRPKGKKGQRIIEPPPSAPGRLGDKKFQCTKCNRGHKYRSDWVRDEENHIPQQSWTCMQSGPRLVIKGNVTCPFCGESNPTDEHLSAEHNTTLCFQKPEQDRTFKRHDGLLRHMNGVHNASIKQPPDVWRSALHENDTQQFWCGFCEEFLRTTWKSRLDHLENHFSRDDFDMTRWRGEPSTQEEPLNDFLNAGAITDPYYHDSDL